MGKGSRNRAIRKIAAELSPVTPNQSAKSIARKIRREGRYDYPKNTKLK